MNTFFLFIPPREVLVDLTCNKMSDSVLAFCRVCGNTLRIPHKKISMVSNTAVKVVDIGAVVVNTSG